MLLAFIDPGYGIVLILGFLISNIFSPVGAIDVIFGTMGTIVAVIGIVKSKGLFAASLWPTISMAVVSAGISIGSGLPYVPTLITVALGEFAVVTLIGYPIFKALMKNSGLMEILRINKD